MVLDLLLPPTTMLGLVDMSRDHVAVRMGYRLDMMGQPFEEHVTTLL